MSDESAGTGAEGPGPLPPPPTSSRASSVAAGDPPADDVPADDAPVDVPVGDDVTDEVTQDDVVDDASESESPVKPYEPRQERSAAEPSDATVVAAAATSRPMTAADYARTVSSDPATTAMFPRIGDDNAPSDEAQLSVASDDDASLVTRQARLTLVHVDPWSVTRMAFVISTALMIVAVVAVTVFWLVLNVTGVWGSLNDTVNSVLSSEDGTFDVEDYLGFGRLVGLTLVLSAINVVLMTALAAVGARLYNAASHLVGGVQVTLRERG